MIYDDIDDIAVLLTIDLTSSSAIAGNYTVDITAYFAIDPDASTISTALQINFEEKPCPDTSVEFQNAEEFPLEFDIVVNSKDATIYTV